MCIYEVIVQLSYIACSTCRRRQAARASAPCEMPKGRKSVVDSRTALASVSSTNTDSGVIDDGASSAAATSDTKSIILEATKNSVELTPFRSAVMRILFSSFLHITRWDKGLLA